MPEPIQETWRSDISDQEVVLATTEQLRWIIQKHQYRGFVWPDEGGFAAGRWSFNEDHLGRFEPVLVDPASASAMLAVRDALNQSNQSKFDKELSEHRGLFGSLLELCWSCTRLTYPPTKVD
jgi:hypothetical protein